MSNTFVAALKKITSILDEAAIDYMIVGGFAVSYHNRARTTNDLDIILQMSPRQVKLILNHFPEWLDFSDAFAQSVEEGSLFNITDFETGIRFDLMTYKDSEYNWTAFGRREEVEFMGVRCFISSREDLILAKLQWYNLSKSEKQLEDLKFLLLDENLDMTYLKGWVKNLKLKTHGLLES